MRKYIADNELGIKLSRGNRVDRARWNEFLGIQGAVKEPTAVPEPQPVSSGRQVCSASMHFCGMIDVDLTTAGLKRVFNGNTQGEIEITFTLKGE